MSTETADRLVDLLRELGTLQSVTGELWLLARESSADKGQVDDLMGHITGSLVDLRSGIERVMADELGDFVDDLVGNVALADDPCSDPDRWIAPNLCKKEVPDAG